MVKPDMIIVGLHPDSVVMRKIRGTVLPESST